MNSMSDVAFLLLIFMMLVSLINFRQEVHIEYAQAQVVDKTSADKNCEIWINIEGDYYLNGNLCTLKDIEEKVLDLYQFAPDTRIHIIADRYTPFEKVQGVLSILQLLQYRVVSFVVKNG
jgi:biopolymer transport protein ExbD